MGKALDDFFIFLCNRDQFTRIQLPRSYFESSDATLALSLRFSLSDMRPGCRLLEQSSVSFSCFSGEDLALRSDEHLWLCKPKNYSEQNLEQGWQTGQGGATSR